MAFNPFKSKPPVDKPSRNAFDLSFANNLTMEFGKLYPVFCKECLPGDTFKIDPTFAFKFMPMYFPVQSRMRADLKFFYVRNRNLWDNWKKFIGQTDRLTGQEVVPPYLEITPQTQSRLTTGSLLDYLGVPTTAPVAIESKEFYPFGGYSNDLGNEVIDDITAGGSSTTSPRVINMKDKVYKDYYEQYLDFEPTFNGSSNTSNYGLTSLIKTPMSSIIKNVVEFKFYIKDEMIWDTATTQMVSAIKQQLKVASGGFIHIVSPSEPPYENWQVTENTYWALKYKQLGFARTTISLGTDERGQYIKAVINGSVYRNTTEVTTIEDLTSLIVNAGNTYKLAFSFSYNYSQILVQKSKEETKYPLVVFPYAVEFKTSVIEENSLPAERNPFIKQQGASAPAIGLSALPCRAYEAIFNSFYRNVEVDPFRINGQIEYEKFIPNSGDGADSYNYDFHHQYWEHDFLTDSLPSPQMGIAPVVGGRPAQSSVYALNTVDGTYKVYTTQQDSNRLLGLAGYTNTLKDSDNKFAPDSAIKALEEAITFGISINDFRNVNALQRWLEKNIRRGYRYKDQMMSHFGVSLSYEECDMPEYLGGVSEDVNVRAISSTAETSNAPLGSYAGQASVLGSSKHTINKYTDEHGFIMGILCITPIPTYSQTLPKHFLKTSPLDFFSPEFGQIGMQPIPLKEVAPLNVALENGNQEETFGYQRAFYEYLSSLDEVHGDFRETLSDYLVDRVFQGIPRLSKQFLEVDASQVNDIFNFTGDGDKIVGQIWFDCEVVRPIPKFGIPKIVD